MEKVETIIRRGERMPVHVKPNEAAGFRVQDGIDYNLDSLQFKYAEKYVGKTITIKYKDANGHETSYGKELEKGGVMSWMNKNAIESPNFGSILFSCSQEIFFEFGFD